MTAGRKRTALDLRRGLRRSAWLAVALCTGSGAFARALDDVRLSRSGDEATVEVELGCAMRYDSHAVNDGNSEVRIRMTLGNDCHLALRTGRSDIRHPVGAYMASLVDIAFDAGQREQAVITLRFDRPVSADVRQTTNLYLLTVAVDAAADTAPRPPPPLPAPVSTETPVAISPAEPVADTREPARLRRTLPYADSDTFVIRLSELRDAGAIDHRALAAFSSQVLYACEIAVGGGTITELRLGFFATEDEASRALAALGPAYTSAWIAVADAGEQAQARERRIENATEPRPATRASAVNSKASAEMPEDRIATMMSEARSALLDRDYPRSVDLYLRLLQQPAGAHRQDARELLGVAWEKSGQPAQARAQYEAWLEEFPENDGADRVRQRLAALAGPEPTIERAAQRSALVTAGDSSSPWDLYGSASQYYLRGVSMAHDDEDDDVVAQSALLSQALLYARRSGERFDIASRANVGYLHDFVEEGSNDQALVSYAWVDVSDTRTDLSARVGRQQPRAGGVLGRFDGIAGSYRYRPDLTLHVSAGFPVDSPGFRATTDQWFYGAGIDLDNVLDAWDFGIFTQLQTIEGLDDRQAVGGRVQYHSPRLNVVGLVDYDASFKIINTGFITGNWRLNDRLTIHGRYRGGAAPFLTTRNALIGQPANTLDELLPDYSAGQLRRLARNRTAEERGGAAGVSIALTPRLQLKADTTWYELSATPASGGIAAFPGTGPQLSWGGHLLGAGFFRPGHLFLLGYRHDETRSVDTDTIFVDVRQPIGERLRLQSRLDIAHRLADQDPAGDVQQWIARPMLRVAYDWRRRYRVELEFGGQWSSRKFPMALVPPLIDDDTLEYTDYYVQLGYTLDF